MKKHYLWVRAWPWYLPTFPFDRFDDLDDAAIWPTLTTLAQQWEQKNPGRIESERRKQYASSRARDKGALMSTSPHAKAPQRTPTDEDFRAPGTFDEIAPLAGWTVRAHGIVMHPQGQSIYHPTGRCLFAGLDDPELADAVLEGLRRRRVRVEPGSSFGGGHAILRYGKTPEDLPRPDRVGLAMRLEDFEGTPVDARGWLGRIAEDAARIVRMLTETTEQPAAQKSRGTGQNSTKDKLSKTEQQALASYAYALEKRPDLTESASRNYNELYATLSAAVRAGECSIYAKVLDIPSSGTWCRYVRKGLALHGSRGADPRHGRDHGSSIVDSDSI